MAAPTPVVNVTLPTTTAITGSVVSATIDRGRTSPVFDEIDAGTCEVVMNNEARTFDPLYSSGPYYGSVIPGATTTVTAGGVTIFSGLVDDWGFDYDVSTRSTAHLSAVDALAVLGRTEFDEWPATSTAAFPVISDRLDAITTRPEVDFTGSTDFDDGPTYLQGDYVSRGSNVLNYCQLIAKTDMGLFFAAKDNTITYRDRLSFIGHATDATFGGSGIGFSGIATSYGKDLLHNRVTVQRAGGTPQTVSDATSITTYKRVNTLALDNLLMQDDTTALDLATRLLAVYKDPLYRIESLEVKLHALSGADQLTVLGLDLGSVVSVEWTPNGVGSAITRTCVVEGISHSIIPAEHTVRLTLNDSSIYQVGDFYTVEDATFGTIDGAGVLDYPIAF